MLIHPELFHKSHAVARPAIAWYTTAAMPYRYVTERSDYSRFASGGVFYHLSGHPAFPVRLMSEVFQRCMAFRRANGCTGPCVLYDPCCGSAYHLSTLAYLHWREIRTILCSDIDPTALAAAKSNLSLLTTAGMDRRCAEIAAMQSQYGKESHAQALAYAQSLQEELLALQHCHSLTTRIFQADALQPLSLTAHLHDQPIDIVFADVPYGQCSQWEGAALSQIPFPIAGLLESLRAIISPHTIVAIASTKHERIAGEGYTRLARMQLGKRMITLLQLGA